MIALIQRVSEAAVTVEQRTVGRIGAGILALIGIQRGDDAARAARLLERVPQFTLAADTHKGTRAGFSGAEPPESARPLFDALVSQARARHPEVATGEFGAHMQVALVNDGPVTFWLEASQQ